MDADRVSVIEGLMTSTVLSLLVISSEFTVMDDFEHRVTCFC